MHTEKVTRAAARCRPVVVALLTFLVVPACGMVREPVVATSSSRISVFDETSDHRMDDTTDAMTLPGIAVFEAKWRKFASSGGLAGHTGTDRLHQQKLEDAQVLSKNSSMAAAGTRVVIGIFTTLLSKSKQYREVIRSTWMSQPRVCSVRAGSIMMRKECDFFVTFVAARNRDSVFPFGENDLTILNIHENIDCGKTLAWFEFAVERYPEATHIAKMDMDAYVDLPRLSLMLHGFADECPRVYGGRTWACGEDYCPPPTCKDPVGTDFRQYSPSKETKEACWTYMQGGFYFMSQLMARDISGNNGWWAVQSKRCSPEDALVGAAIQHWGSEHTTSCIAVMDLKGSEVIWHADHAESWDEHARLPV
uniref:Hexosyltransferase n=1 Tax=Alexandrium catenella TaxID=2925 RepID=A0A7S1W1Y0_ALECA